MGWMREVIQNQTSPDFRFPEVGISVLVTSKIKLKVVSSVNQNVKNTSVELLPAPLPLVAKGACTYSIFPTISRCPRTSRSNLNSPIQPFVRRPRRLLILPKLLLLLLGHYHNAPK